MPKILVLFIIFFTSVCSNAFSSEGKIIFVKGEVKVINSKGKARSAKKGSSFAAGETILTGKKSFAVLRLPDESKIKLDPTSKLTVKEVIKKSTTGHKGSSKFVLGVGGAMVDVLKVFAGPPSVEIKTKKGIALGVRGTVFYTFYDTESNDIWTHVRHGKVLAMREKEDDSEMIENGQAIVFLGGNKLTNPYKYKWIQKIKWNMEAGKEMDSGAQKFLKEEGKKEVKKVMKKITKRKKKPFLKNLKSLIDKYGNKVREELYEYEEAEHLVHEIPGVNPAEIVVLPGVENINLSPVDPNDPGSPIKSKGQGSGVLVDYVTNAIQAATNLCQKIHEQTNFSCTKSNSSCGNGRITVGIFIEKDTNVTYYSCLHIPSYNQLPNLGN